MASGDGLKTALLNASLSINKNLVAVGGVDAVHNRVNAAANGRSGRAWLALPECAERRRLSTVRRLSAAAVRARRPAHGHSTGCQDATVEKRAFTLSRNTSSLWRRSATCLQAWITVL